MFEEIKKAIEWEVRQNGIYAISGAGGRLCEVGNIGKTVWGVDMGKSPDYVGISSEEYKQLKKCESELAHYKHEAKKIPIYCSYADWLDTGYCTPKVQCPQICPKWRGGGQDV